MWGNASKCSWWLSLGCGDDGWYLLFTLCFYVFLILCNGHVLLIKLGKKVIKHEKKLNKMKYKETPRSVGPGRFQGGGGICDGLWDLPDSCLWYLHSISDLAPRICFNSRGHLPLMSKAMGIVSPPCEGCPLQLWKERALSVFLWHTSACTSRVWCV